MGDTAFRQEELPESQSRLANTLTAMSRGNPGSGGNQMGNNVGAAAGPGGFSPSGNQQSRAFTPQELALMAMEATTAPGAQISPQTQQSQPAKRDGGFFGPEKKGIGMGMVGGIIMMVIAVVWFVGGLAADIIFFYPPILFVIGLFAFFKGLVTGNVAGEKNRNRR